MIFSIPKGRLAQSSLRTGGLLGLRVLTQAAALVLLTRLLGPQVYGGFAAAAALAVVLGTLPNLGAGYVLMARAPKNAQAAADVWRYAWPTTTLLGVMLLLGYLPAARHITGSSPLPWQVLFWLGATELLITPFVMLLSSALQAEERVPLSQFIQWLPLALRALATLPCFLIGDDQRIQAYAALQFIAAIVGLIVGLRVTLRHVRLDWNPRPADKSELKQGAAFAIMHLVAANPSELDKVLAPRLIGEHDAGIYAATTRVVGAAVMPVVAMLLAAQPRLFRHAHEPHGQGRHLVRTIAALALAWGLLSWLLLTLGSPIITWLFGSRFDEVAQLMPWLAAAAAPISLRLAAGTLLITLGRPMDRAYFEFGGILILAGSMMALAPQLGVRGLAIALLISESSMALAGWCLALRRARQRSVP